MTAENILEEATISGYKIISKKFSKKKWLENNGITRI